MRRWSSARMKRKKAEINDWEQKTIKENTGAGGQVHA
jgi:hypothetical protein